MQVPPSSQRLSQRQQDLLALLLILVVAGLFRLWQIDRFPPGLFGDEATNGLDALDALAGRARVFYPANYGREGLHMLLLAPVIHLLGPIALALRLPSVMAGILTALATYWLGRELFSRTWLAGTWVPLLAALFLSTSYWHVHFSRFGIRGVFTPLMATLAFAALWRAANRTAGVTAAGQRAGRDGRCWSWFLAAGLFTGLGVHFYTASRLVPIFLAAFLLVQAPFAWWFGRKACTHPPLLMRAFGPLAGMGVVAALVFAPLGLYFLRTPGSLTQRASAVSLANPEISGGDPLRRLLDAATANVLQFFQPGAGDAAQFYNLPGRPVFDLVTAAAVLMGIGLCLWALKRGSSPHLFLLLWFPVMLAPTFLAVDRFPTLPRALGVLPGIYFFPAVALGELTRWAKRRAGPSGRLAVAAAALAIGLLIWQGAFTARDYFTRWAPAQETFDAFEGDIAAAASWLAGHPGEEVFLSSDIYRHPSFVFLHEQAPLTEIFTYADPSVHFFDGRSSLPLPPAGQAATYLFTHNSGPDAAVQPIPGWPAFTLQDAGAPGLTVATLDAAPDPVAGLGLASAQQPFSPELRLAGYRLIPSGDTAALAVLLWETAAPIPGNSTGYQIQVGLQPPGPAPQVTQASAELSYRPSEWRPGSRVLAWQQLDLPAGMPDDLQLAVRVIDQVNGVPLPAEGSSDDGWILLPLPKND